MAPTLYHVPKTISSPIVQLIMHLDLLNEIHIETLSFADLKSPQHLARNPMGTSPTFVIDNGGDNNNNNDNIIMWESGAIISYILEVYDTKYKFHPSPIENRVQRAKFLHSQQYIIATVYPFVASLFVHSLKPKEQQDLDYINTATEKWCTLLAPTLEKMLSPKTTTTTTTTNNNNNDNDDSTKNDNKHNYYALGGNEVSMIDFLLAKPLNNSNSMNLLSDFPILSKLFHNVACLPSFQKAYNLPQCHTTESERSILLVPKKDQS